MAKVTSHNGDNHSTAEGMTHYRFSGTPTDQYEHRMEIGEQRVMQVVVMCVGSGEDQISDGVRHLTKLRVVNAEIGELHKPASDPQLFDDEGERLAGEYGDYTDERGDEQGEDGTPSNVVSPQFSSNA